MIRNLSMKISYHLVAAEGVKLVICPSLALLALPGITAGFSSPLIPAGVRRARAGQRTLSTQEKQVTRPRYYEIRYTEPAISFDAVFLTVMNLRKISFR